MFDHGVVTAALDAIFDGESREICIEYGDTFTGYVWEIYRSIVTRSIRIRVCDLQGRVFHANSLSITID